MSIGASWWNALLRDDANRNWGRRDPCVPSIDRQMRRGRAQLTGEVNMKNRTFLRTGLEARVAPASSESDGKPKALPR
ncbi:MAG: hypothetical protein C7B47_16225 [Sulfobacillus thermosulfidooxidans]|uniref:Uncharacterized protein n=1 Tax=Sulfobacillus thermosulfidooxidans TaxID=28034 RepID=A0A2T2WLH3_SULTH|nr:MAG: hypothetical protein C7B47_16225 [Sulfobacillus thermosulfidooxidans]